jgi:apolipoprotein N-acyltransferase
MAARGKAGWLLNVTNDAWFGTSAGPYQHFHQARIRAVEQGLPLVRAANTGISAIVDPYGRVVAQLGLDERGVVDGLLPRALPPTFFARHGPKVELAVLMLALLSWFAYRVQRAA